MTPPLRTLSITSLARLLRSRAVTATAVVEECLAQIAEDDRVLNAFITVMADAARADARRADEEIMAGRYRGSLHGVPVTVKDVIDVRGVPTTAASRLRAGHVAREDAPVVVRLREAGAVLIGKCNLHEFAFGTTGEDSAFGPTRNPYDRSRSPGGSSSGSAAAVAAGLSYASVGTDTGGSIQIPAAACGLVGLKPAFGDLPCDSVVMLSRSLDHVWPIARTVRDAWLLYRAMAGEACAAADGTDDTTRPPTRPSTHDPQRLRLGLPRTYLWSTSMPGFVTASIRRSSNFQLAGYTVREVEIEHSADIASIYRHISTSEAATYHARTLDSRPQDYTPDVRSRLEMGRSVLPDDYARAQRGRERLREQVDEALNWQQQSPHDALVLPTLPIPAPPLGATSVPVGGTSESVRTVMLRLTQLFNLTGHPAISIPCAATPEGLPCGLQLVGSAGRTADLLRVALSCEPHVAAAAARGYELGSGN